MEKPDKDLFSIMALAWSFVPFNVVRFAIEEDVFLLLEKEEQTISEFAKTKKWQLRPTQALISILSSLDLLKVNDSKLYLSEKSRNFFIPNSDLYMGDFFIRNDLLQKAYTELQELFVSDAPNMAMNLHVKNSFGLTVGSDHKTIEEFGKPMMAASKIVYTDFFSQFPIDAESSILDIGGGIGTLEQMLMRQGHKGKITLLETEDVARIAENILDAYPIEIIKENWSNWTPEAEYDHVFLSHVLHEEKMEGARALFEKAVKSTKIGGQVVVIGFMGEEADYQYIGDIFRMNLLLEMGSDLPSLCWLRQQAQELKLQEKKTFNLEGGRIAWVAVKTLN